MIFGSRGDTGKRTLYHNTSQSDDIVRFNAGSLNTYELEAVDLNKLERITLGHDGVGHGAGLYVSHVSIQPKDTSDVYYFSCERWLDDHEGDRKIEQTLTLTGLCGGHFISPSISNKYDSVDQM